MGQRNEHPMMPTTYFSRCLDAVALPHTAGHGIHSRPGRPSSSAELRSVAYVHQAALDRYQTQGTVAQRPGLYRLPTPYPGDGNKAKSQCRRYLVSPPPYSSVCCSFIFIVFSVHLVHSQVLRCSNVPTAVSLLLRLHFFPRQHQAAPGSAAVCPSLIRDLQNPVWRL